ncbi:MAG: pilus assembly protein [Gammaproteobacteria bacterium]|nr:MAG: pilus assembly protein [Gammaproteobacteria bacterium]
MRSMCTSPTKQKGAALLVGLILLLILTVLGVASLNDTVVQNKMSGAMQDTNAALQAADSAVREAEAFIDGLTTLAGFVDNNGLYTEGKAPDPYDAATWTGTVSAVAPGTHGQSTKPRYFIELMGDVQENNSNTSVNIQTYSHESGAGQLKGFRIVGRATGASGVAQRIVESYYVRRF